MCVCILWIASACYWEFRVFQLLRWSNMPLGCSWRICVSVSVYFAPFVRRYSGVFLSNNLIIDHRISISFRQNLYLYRRFAHAELELPDHCLKEALVVTMSGVMGRVFGWIFLIFGFVWFDPIFRPDALGNAPYAHKQLLIAWLTDFHFRF
jgi:hypothetical protein